MVGWLVDWYFVECLRAAAKMGLGAERCDWDRLWGRALRLEQARRPSAAAMAVKTDRI